METIWRFGLLGVVPGGAYALIALGILAVYKGSRVINLAQTAMGMVGCYIFWLFYAGGDGLPLWLSIVLALATSAFLGAVVYLGAMRFVREASETIKLVTTVGVLITLMALVSLIFSSRLIEPGQIFGDAAVKIFGATFTMTGLVVIVSVIVMAAAIWFIFSKTRLGMRATALTEAASAANSVGISPHPTGAITWALGAVLATIAGIALLPTSGLSPNGLNASLVPALAAVLVARFSSVSITVLVSLAFGVIYSLGIGFSWPREISGTLPLIVIVVVLLLRGTSLPARDDSKFRQPAIGSGKIQWPATIVVMLGAFALIFFAGPSFTQAVLGTAIAIIIGLSVVVVTGYAGQLSLAPLALAGLSALVTARLASTLGWPFLPAVIAGVVAAGIVGLLFGAPAARVRGANLAIVTLGLAQAIEISLLTNPALTGATYGLPLPSRDLFGLELDTQLYAVFVVIVTALAALVVVNLRSNASGRRFAAIRASERGAAALGVSVARTKLAAFGIAGALAGLGGALAVFRFPSASFTQYGLFASLTLIGLVVVGGVAYISGSLFAGLLAAGGVIGVLFTFTLKLSAYEPYLAILTGVMIIATMAFFPDGQMPMNIVSVKGLVAKFARKKHPETPATVEALDEDTSKKPVTGAVSVAAGGTYFADDYARRKDAGPLVVRDVTVRFGGVTALDSVSFTAEPGKVLGIIGPNGAGKTTLIDVISGFRKPTEGWAEYKGQRLKAANPVSAAKRGIARTFQNLELFDDLTVRENLLIAFENFPAYAFASDPFWRRKSVLSSDVISSLERFGLADAIDMKVEDLPQGKRRLVAVSRAIAQGPDVICLDEPAAGVSAAERPELGLAMKALAKELNLAVVLVEHDIDLVASVCDEVVAIDFGRVIARGTPAEVLRDASVRTAYMGEPAEDRVLVQEGK